MSLMTYIDMSRTGNFMRKGQTTSEETKRKIGDANRGKVLSKETREKISQSTKGRIPWNKDKVGVMPEPWNKGKEHMQGSNHPMFEKHPSEKTLKRMSESHKGKQTSEEAKQKMSEARKGRVSWNRGLSGYKCQPCSKETKHKIGDANRGRIVSEETRQKLSISGKGNLSNTGRSPSEETRKRMSEARSGEKSFMYGKHHSEETKRKIAEKAIGRKASEEARQKMSEAHTGERNHEWKGGVTFFPYCHKFNEKLKERIRVRDNHTCQLCNEKQNGRKLDIHHIRHDRENCAPMLISLCRKCHGKTNINRDYYEALFMSKLRERGLIE